MRGKYARYWIVRSNEAEAWPDSANNSEKDAMELMVAQCTAELDAEDAERLRRGDLKEDMDRDSSWVKRVRWVNHFGSRDLLDIFKAAEWIRAKSTTAGRGREQDEDGAQERLILLRLGESFDREVERCSWRLDSVPTETLQWLASIVSTTPSGMPFGLKGKEASMAKYRTVGHRYLGFCWRAHHIGRDEALERWAIRFTDEQWSLLCDVADELERSSIASSHNHSCNDQDSEDGADDDAGDEGMYSRKDNDTLDRAVFLFMVASIKTQVGGHIYSNSLLCFCAALGIRSRPLGYTEPHLYTGMLAAILWWSRLFFLEAAFEDQPQDQDEVGIKAVIAFRDQHAVWMCVGAHTVVSTIIGWMALGKGWRMRMGGQPSVRWAEDGESLFHNGERIMVQEFTRALRNQVVEAQKLLDSLFAGDWERYKTLVKLGRIVDSMVRLGAGQSFATNAKNSWLEPGPAVVMRQLGTSIWDPRKQRLRREGVRQWLRRLRMFREVLMVLVHAWGGLPGRGPEVATLRHCDSWQLIRNIFVLDGQVMMVTDRDKMKAIRDNSRKVARW
ncbi:hypothetical protein COL26b_014168 [Colletotrichum chrysophilum]|uniref:uncharacterized protein n=1 Tax=Colletotrichum chrysophilum TaxID=1836956 RepID=UPI002300FB71|nr:uncharacterized protein COL26b_014168 [Colletotrichum chrysophilum]KAJ0360120.1 hypothetical protein COL26b_014168 [Colletotrichum chrysophilum]